MSDPIQTTSHFRAQSSMQNRPGASQAFSPRFNKACDSCHISKVRCFPDPQSPIGTCKRCSKNGTSCTFSPVGPRRRPVRTKNDRIAELERRVRDMQIKLEKQVDKRSDTLAHSTASNINPVLSRAASATQPLPPSGAGVAVDAGSSEKSPSIVSGAKAGSAAKLTARTNDVVAEGFRRKHGEEHDGSRTSASIATAASDLESAGHGKGLDMIDRGLITKHEAGQLIREFRLALNGKYLGICLPTATSESQLRRTRPAFWLSILCAASAGSPQHVHLAPTLFRELKTILDIRIIPGGQPDLDALQALMSWVIFHHDPVFPLGEHMVEMYSIAVQVIVDIAEASKLHSLPADAPLLDDDVSEGDIQLSRELLHWYWASFSIAFKRRTPRMVHQTHLVDASLRILQSTSNQSDARLIQWIKLVQIATDAVLALQHGHTQQVDGLSDEARDVILDSFEKKRKQWLVDCPFHLVNEPLMLEYHSMLMLLSEVIYPAGVADFKQRSYGLPSLSSPGDGPVPDRNFLAAYKVNYTVKSIHAAHACLDIATAPVKPDEINADSSPAADLLRRCGCFLHTRIFYALRLLLSVAHETWRTQKYNIIDVNMLKIDFYIIALRDRLETASQQGRYRVPTLWLNALQAKIEPWWQTLRRLLENDGQVLTTTLKESSKPSSRPISPPKTAGLTPPDCQLLVADFDPDSLDPHFPPFFPTFPSDFFGSEPVSVGLANEILLFNGLLEIPAVGEDVSTTVAGDVGESGLLPAMAQQHMSNERNSQHEDVPKDGANSDSVNDTICDPTTKVDKLDPSTFDWANLSEFLCGSDMFSTLPPCMGAEVPEPTEFLDQREKYE